MLGKCHINVEVSCTVNLIMYLYNYIFKGPDRARFHVGDSLDEIQDCQLCGWIGGVMYATVHVLQLCCLLGCVCASVEAVFQCIAIGYFGCT